MPFQPGAKRLYPSFWFPPRKRGGAASRRKSPSHHRYSLPSWQAMGDTVGNAEYVLTSFSTSGNVTTANWALLGTDTGALNTLTGDSGVAISPSAGNIKLAGTPSQIATIGLWFNDHPVF